MESKGSLESGLGSEGPVVELETLMEAELGKAALVKATREVSELRAQVRELERQLRAAASDRTSSLRTPERAPPCQAGDRTPERGAPGHAGDEEVWGTPVAPSPKTATLLRRKTGELERVMAELAVVQGERDAALDQVGRLLDSATAAFFPPRPTSASKACQTRPASTTAQAGTQTPVGDGIVPHVAALLLPWLLRQVIP